MSWRTASSPKTRVCARLEQGRSGLAAIVLGGGGWRRRRIGRRGRFAAARIDSLDEEAKGGEAERVSLLDLSGAARSDGGHDGGEWRPDRGSAAFRVRVWGKGGERREQRQAAGGLLMQRRSAAARHGASCSVRWRRAVGTATVTVHSVATER